LNSATGQGFKPAPRTACFENCFPEQWFFGKRILYEPKSFCGLLCLLALARAAAADGQTTRLVVAYASPAATFVRASSPKAKGCSRATASMSNWCSCKGRRPICRRSPTATLKSFTAVARPCRAIATGGFDLVVIATETETGYVRFG